MIQPTLSLEMLVPSQGNCGFPSFPVVDWFVFVDLWVFPLTLLASHSQRLLHDLVFQSFDIKSILKYIIYLSHEVTFISFDKRLSSGNWQRFIISSCIWHSRRICRYGEYNITKHSSSVTSIYRYVGQVNLISTPGLSV